MSHIAHVEINIILSDDLPLEQRAEWASHAPPMIGRLMNLIDAEAVIQLKVSEEEIDAMKKYIKEHGNKKMKERFDKAAERGGSSDAAERTTH